MPATTWNAATDRVGGPELDGVADIEAARGLLKALRMRWQESVDVVTSMFDFKLVPAGSSWPPRDGEWVDVRFTDEIVEVSLLRSRPRRDLAQPGGVATVAGDICRPARAAAVVESFLYQIASPNDAQN